MLSKYRITVTEVYTGKEVVPEVECNGFLIQGYIGQRDEDGCYSGVKTRIHEASRADISMGLFHNDATREAMYKGTIAGRKVERKRVWRRLFGLGEGK